MAEGITQAADAFREALGSTERVQTRDEAGRFAESKARPEPLFSERQTEGDEFGDTRDGGEDARRRRQEERANGEPFDQGNLQDGRGKPGAKKSVRSESDDGHFGETGGQGDGDDESESQGEADVLDSDEDAEGERGDTEGDAEPDAEGDQKYEVTVDGKPMEVTLQEALNGYIRVETFHQRMNKVNEASQTVMAEAQRVAQARDNYINQNAALEQEIMTLLPQQPDWDAEFAKNPQAAHALRKQYEAVEQKLNGLRQSRMAAFQEQQAETARKTESYAKEQFAKFVMDNKIPDEGALRKEIQSMRRTAMSAGFSEYEVATVYDSRMLSVLRKASRYDRLMAGKPKAVIPGKGRALTPGSAPRIGNAGRRNIDEAQSRLAKSGRLDDAASVFEKIIR